MLNTAGMGVNDLIQLITSVRDGDFDEFKDFIHKAFVGSKEETTHLAHYLWGVYGPQQETLDDEDLEDES